MKQLIKNFFNLFGLELRRYQPQFDPTTQVYKAIKKIKTDIIFDIGANTGQFALDIRKKGYKGKIISFEPLTTARKKLLDNANKDNNWIVHEKAALGEHNGFVNLNISKNSVSSSILPMLSTHIDAENDSVYIGVEKSPLITLDSVAEFYVDQSSNYFSWFK